MVTTVLATLSQRCSSWIWPTPSRTWSSFCLRGINLSDWHHNSTYVDILLCPADRTVRPKPESCSPRWCNGLAAGIMAMSFPSTPGWNLEHSIPCLFGWMIRACSNRSGWNPTRQVNHRVTHTS